MSISRLRETSRSLMRRISFSSLLLLLCGTLELASAAVIRVTPTGSGANPSCGGGWASPCTLAYALQTVAESGDELWVSAGTYKPTTTTDRTISFVLRSGVALYGGFTGTETDRSQRNWGANTTSLSGDIGAGGESTDNSYHVVVGSGTAATAVLDGFTVTAGRADGTGYDSCGGGMLNAGGSPVVANCTFSGNAATFGGGMYVDTNLSPPITNCTISANTAQYGGGIYLYGGAPRITGCTFSANTATSTGGGMHSASTAGVFTNCTYTGNAATSGGGIFLGGGAPQITGCTFSANNVTDSGGGAFSDKTAGVFTSCTFSSNAAQSGGGLFFHEDSSQINLCTFSGNTAAYGGGGALLSCSPKFAGCAFSGNIATETGGGLHMYDGDAAVSSSTFTSNAASKGGGIFNGTNSSPVVTGCTFTGNTATEGGGMYNYDSSQQPRRQHLHLRGQRRDLLRRRYVQRGGSTPTVASSTFADNSATKLAGG